MVSRAIAYPPAARAAAAALFVVSRFSLLFLLYLVVVSNNPPLNPLRLMRLFAWLVIVPVTSGWFLARAFACTVSVEGGSLVLRSRSRRVEIPCASIAAIVPWKLPLPQGGVSIRLGSGRRFGAGLQIGDAVAAIEAVADAGAPDDVRAAALHPIVLYTRAKSSVERRWYHYALKFPAFALVPTLPLWRLHQWIAYGGTFGEYHTYGLKAYLLGFAIYWGTLSIYLVLWAAVLRAVAEAIALASTYAAPSRSARVRRNAEMMHRIFFFSAVPAFLVLRFYPW